jgi:hypothetical protein
LSEAQRIELGRRLRLEWACQRDPEQLAGVKRLIAEGERIAMRRGRDRQGGRDALGQV